MGGSGPVSRSSFRIAREAQCPFQGHRPDEPAVLMPSRLALVGDTRGRPAGSSIHTGSNRTRSRRQPPAKPAVARGGSTIVGRYPRLLELQQTKVLAAVGSVDSLTLLHLMSTTQKAKRPRASHPHNRRPPSSRHLALVVWEPRYNPNRQASGPQPVSLPVLGHGTPPMGPRRRHQVFDRRSNAPKPERVHLYHYHWRP